jgi:hypothetical protein
MVRTRQSVCERKARYRHAGDAAEAARAAGLPLFPYHCDRCRQFHLTSRSKGRRIPRPAAEGE